MTDTATDTVIDPLVILLSRLSRDVLLSEERDQLRDHVDALVTERNQLRAKIAEMDHALSWHTTCASCARILDSAYAETIRAEKAEARVTALEAENARLTAGQCIHHVGICDLHHTTPVTGCPYPRCTTKLQTVETTRA